ncbi:unnamed protein product [Hymenolepis diminuta]|nr:unnamed protein product [Hymenolepis diminuta]
MLHSMVRHAGFEVTTGCHSCSPPTISGASSSVPRARSTSSTPPPPPPIKTLAEAVSKSVAGALLHTCPLSVDMVDRGAQVMQTLILRFAHLGEPITFHYTDLLLEHVCSNMTTSSPNHPVTIPSMSQVVSDFIVPPSSMARIRKLKGKKPTQKGQEDEKCAPPVGRIIAMASRLLCLTRSRLGGAQTGTPSIASTETPSPSCVAKIPQQQSIQTTTTTESGMQYPPTTSTIGAATQVSVAATVVEPTADESNCIREAQDSPMEENSESVGKERAHILTRSYIRRSRSRYRAVQRRQMETMLRRTAWFLGSTPTPTIRLPTTPQLVVTSEGVPCAPTSTQSLLEIGMSMDIVEQRKYQTESEIKKSQEMLGVPFYLSPLPRVSVTSIRSAPTGQASPMISLHVDSEEEEECEGFIEESRSIPLTEL